METQIGWISWAAANRILQTIKFILTSFFENTSPLDDILVFLVCVNNCPPFFLWSFTTLLPSLFQTLSTRYINKIKFPTRAHTEITKPSYLYHRKTVSTLHKRFYDYHRYLLGVVVSGQKSFGDLGPKDLFDVIGNTISRG